MGLLAGARGQGGRGQGYRGLLAGATAVRHGPRRRPGSLPRGTGVQPSSLLMMAMGRSPEPLPLSPTASSAPTSASGSGLGLGLGLVLGVGLGSRSLVCSLTYYLLTHVLADSLACLLTGCSLIRSGGPEVVRSDRPLHKLGRTLLGQRVDGTTVSIGWPNFTLIDLW